MSELKLTVGLPGSGKSTLAEKMIAEDPTGNTIRVNRDNIRMEVLGEWYTGIREDENKVTVVQEARVREGLAAGKTVIVDDTNLNAFVRERWETIAREAGSTYEMIPLLVDVETCVARTQKRYEELGARQVPREVIERMAEQFLKSLSKR